MGIDQTQASIQMDGKMENGYKPKTLHSYFNELGPSTNLDTYAIYLIFIANGHPSKLQQCCQHFRRWTLRTRNLQSPCPSIITK